MKCPVWADFHAAVASDAFFIIKPDRGIRAVDGVYRAEFPACAAHLALRLVDDGALEEIHPG